MTTLATGPGTSTYHEPEPARGARTKIVGSRLLLGANASVQLSFLFAFLYLRANNFDNGWLTPLQADGSTSPAPAAPPGVAVIVIQILMVLALAAAVIAARAAISRAARFPSGALLGAIGLGLACLGARVYQLLHTGWTVKMGSYVGVSVLWFAVIAAFTTIGILWMVKVLTNRALRDPLETSADLQAVTEYWGFMTVTSIFVALLVQFVH